jgi:DNA-binding response OmpR family regulator
MSAVRMIDSLAPDVVILDVNMPSGSGLAVCELISSGDRMRNTPIIMLTGESQPETVRRCYEMCAYYVLKCPDVWSRVRPLLEEILARDFDAAAAEPNGGSANSDLSATTDDVALDVGTWPVVKKPNAATATSANGNALVDAVFAALNPADVAISAHSKARRPADSGISLENPTCWILSIDDDPDLAASLEMRLCEHNVAVRRALAGMEGYRRAFVEPAQAILLDFEMPGGNGDYVLRRLKENPVTRDIPVIVLTGRHEKSIERTMFNLGATAFLTKPYTWPQLWGTLRPYVAQQPLAGDGDAMDVVLTPTLNRFAKQTV